jgi:tRNA A-37 threonylcarbamoyl transferase component Bud32
MQHILQVRPDEQMQAGICAPASAAPRRSCGGDFTAIAVSEVESCELARLVASPERILSDPTATVVKRGRSALVVRVELSIGGNETPAAYKRCGSRTWLRRIARGVRTPAALRNFELGHRLIRLGIATPRPLVAVAPRWHNLLKPSFLATQWIDDAMPFDAFARAASDWAPDRRRAALCEAARKFGRLIGTLHKHGFSHRDLKSGNLLVRDEKGHVEVFLVDLDGASRPRLRIPATRLKNLARLHAASRQLMGVTHSIRCRFVHSYLATLRGHADWKAVWRHLQRTSKISPRLRHPRTTS